MYYHEFETAFEARLQTHTHAYIRTLWNIIARVLIRRFSTCCLPF